MRITGVVMAMVLAAAAAAAEGDFTRTMTPAERTATGLDRLTPEELARLKAIVERYKSGEVAVAEERAGQKVAAAEAKAKEAEARVVAQPADKGARQPGWLSALITLKRTEAKPDEAEEVKDRLKGSLVTFNGRRSFTLENGQVWQMIETGSYAGPELEAPVVTVRPSMGGAFWLKIQAAPLRVKVKPVKLE